MVTANCNAAAADGTFADIQNRSTSWGITPSNRTACVSVEFDLSSQEDPCDHVFFGFSYTSSSGKEAEQIAFTVSYRWDLEVAGIS